MIKLICLGDSCPLLIQKMPIALSPVCMQNKAQGTISAGCRAPEQPREMVLVQSSRQQRAKSQSEVLWPCEHPLAHQEHARGLPPSSKSRFSPAEGKRQ